MSNVSRRELLLAGGALGTVRLAGAAGQKDMTNHSNTDIVSLTAVELSERIRSRQVSCAEVMEAYLRQIDRYNPKVNAIVSLQDRDSLLRQAKERDTQLAKGQYLGWMHGFPHAVKDLTATKGIRTSYGLPLLDGVPDHDALCVERLRHSGAILIGKTNAPELGYGSQTYNTVFGTTFNAYDQSKCAGGSSGGAAVALALRMVPVADGSDFMGSLRNPAAFNNVFGFRPSWGRVPEAGDELFLSTISTAGPMGRSARDVAMLLSVMAGPDPRAPLAIDEKPQIFAGSLQRDFHGTRIGWLGDFGGYLPMQSGILDLCRKSGLGALESLGCRVDDARPDFTPERLWETWLTLRHASSAGGLGGLYQDPTKRAGLKPEIQWEIAGGLAITAVELQRASGARSDWYRALQALFQHFDYLAIPTAQVFPFDAQVHWPSEIEGRKMDTYHRWMEVVIGASLAGLPAINVPVGFGVQGLPMGMQIIGRRHADFAVLQLAHAYEQVAPWAHDRPRLLST
jgi:amidase